MTEPQATATGPSSTPAQTAAETIGSGAVPRKKTAAPRATRRPPGASSQQADTVALDPKRGDRFQARQRIWPD